MSRNRIIVTQKGLELQQDFTQPLSLESLTPLTPIQTTRSPPSIQPPSPSSPSFKYREGYFRPKEVTHATLKTSFSPRIYPNYLKRDPREYPSKHQCVWSPIPTVNSSKVIQPAFPTTNNVHHTLYDSGNDIGPQAPTIKDLNSVVSGKYGHITMNMTSCQYPGYKTQNLKDSTLRESPTSIAGSMIWKGEKRSNSEGVISPQGSSTKIGFKLPFHKLPSSCSIIINDQKGASSISQFTEGDSMTKLYVSKTHRELNKISDEKVELAFNRYNQSQKDYINLLDRLDRKMKDKLFTQLENVNSPAFTKRMNEGAAVLESARVKEQKETARYKNRLKNFTDSKYGKVWGKYEDFSKKTTQAHPNLSNIGAAGHEISGRESIRRDSVATSQGGLSTRRTAKSTEMSQIFKKGEFHLHI